MATPNPSIPATRVNRLRAAVSQGVISIDDKLEFHDDNDRQDFLDHLAAPLGPVSDVLDAYFSAVTTITDDQFDRIQAFIDEIDYAGLAADLVDACFLRAGQNTGSNSPKTLKLNTGTLIGGTTQWGPEGLFFDGNDYATFPITTPPTSFTLVVDQRFSAQGGSGDSAPFGIENNAGYTTAAQKIYSVALGHAKVYGRQGGTFNSTGVIGSATDFTGISPYNRQQQFVGLTYKDQAPPQVLVYVDGVLALDTVANTVRCTSGLNQVSLGGLNSSTAQFRGEIASWALFNRVLTLTEHRTVMTALRHLDSKPLNIVVLGDSFSSQIVASGGENNWPYQLSRLPHYAGQARIMNHSVSGNFAVTLDALVPSHVVLHKPNDTVKETILIYAGGVDGLNAGQGYAGETTAVTNTMRQAQTAGITVFWMNLPKFKVTGPGPWVAAEETNRGQFNTVMTDSKLLYHALIDAEKLFGSTATNNAAAYWADDVHLNAQGHLELASLISSGRAAAALDGSISGDLREGSVAVPTATNAYVDLTFTPAFASANWSLVMSMVEYNAAVPGSLIWPVTISNKSTAGGRVYFNALAPAAGYTFKYIARL